jgi:starch phosphorylase
VHHGTRTDRRRGRRLELLPASTNGWGIDGDVDSDTDAQDRRHGALLYDLLEQQVVPLFYDRDWPGTPRRWIAMMKRSLQTVGPIVAASRIVGQYVEDVDAAPWDPS